MRLGDFLLTVLITAIWGANFSVIKLGLSSIDPFTLTGLRFLLCALPLVFFIKRPDVSFYYVAAYGLAFGTGVWGLVSLGIYFGVSAGVASLVLQLSAFFTVILSYVFLRENIDGFKKTGCIFAFAGLMMIIAITDGSVSYMGLLMVICAALSWSVANIIVKKSGTKTIFPFVVWSSLFSPLPLFLLAYFTQGQNILFDLANKLDGVAAFSIVFQVIPTTLFGYWVWNSLLKRYPASTVAPLSLLVPIFGMIASAAIFNEQIGMSKIFACILIISGLILSIAGARLSNLLPKRFTKAQ